MPRIILTSREHSLLLATYRSHEQWNSFGHPTSQKEITRARLKVHIAWRISNFQFWSRSVSVQISQTQQSYLWRFAYREFERPLALWDNASREDIVTTKALVPCRKTQIATANSRLPAQASVSLVCGSCSSIAVVGRLSECGWLSLKR